MQNGLAALKALFSEIADLQATGELLSWDQETFMPAGGAAARAEALATVKKAAHGRLVSDELARVLDQTQALAQAQGPDSLPAAFVRAARREQARARKLPGELVAELAKATALGLEAWREARAQSDFSAFAPHLEKIVELSRRKAEALAVGKRLYDSMLDEYEPGTSASQAEAALGALRAGLVPLAREINARKDEVSSALLHGACDEGKQFALCQDVVRRLGFDPERGRQDLSAHPFTSAFSVDDVRITTRVAEDYLPTALYGSVHECGHALYSQGIDKEYERTPLGGGASLGVDESQSRLWENIVGRGRPFCAWLLPTLKERFPDRFSRCGLEDFYRALNKVGPSLIRIEADEVTYNLHILLRFELEADLIEGRLQAAQAPAAWNAKSAEYLGVIPPNDRFGILQDIHWAGGLIGYFPTYALGNIMSAQFYAKALGEIPDLEARIRGGDFASLRGWLKENIHRHGRRYTANELLRRVTGTGLDCAPFLDYLRKKYSEIYGFDPRSLGS